MPITTKKVITTSMLKVGNNLSCVITISGRICHDFHSVSDFHYKPSFITSTSNERNERTDIINLLDSSKAPTHYKTLVKIFQVCIKSIGFSLKLKTISCLKIEFLIIGRKRALPSFMENKADSL